MVDIWLFLSLSLGQKPTAEYYTALQAVDVQTPQGVKTDGDSPYMCRVYLVVGRDGFPRSAEAQGCRSDYGQASVTSLLQWRFEPISSMGLRSRWPRIFWLSSTRTERCKCPGF